jgi:hypothetical protein
MSIKLSCGCLVTSYDDAIQTSVKRWTKEGNPAIDVGMYCLGCRNTAWLYDELLETTKDENNWLEQKQ